MIFNQLVKSIRVVIPAHAGIQFIHSVLDSRMRGNDGIPLHQRVGVAALFFLVIPILSFADDIDATLQWSRRVELSTPVSGVVTEILVQRGDKVQKDQPLLRLDTRARQANFEQAKAQVERRTRLRDEAQRELDRSQELYKATLLSNHDLEMARIGFADAEAELQHAKATLAQAESDVNYSTIHAPFDGKVVQRFAEIGQTVATQLQVTPLLVVADTEHMIATTMVSLHVAQRLKVDQSAAVTAAGHRYNGKILHIGLEPVSGKKDETRYAVDVIFDVANATLRAGESAKISLP